MPFLSVGVEHSTSTLAVRERVALEGDTLLAASAALVADQSISEAVVLSTCNRTELYLWVESLEPAIDAARDVLAGGDTAISDYLRAWHEMEAAEHLFRVASGLESQVPGEGQIIGQVREAFDIAQGVGTVGPNLHALFRAAIACGRRARSGTSLGRLERSVGSEAVREAERRLGSLEGRSLLVVGGGEISRLVARELKARRPGRLWIANRTVSVASTLAAEFGGIAVPLDQVAHVLPHADGVFSATSAPAYVLVREDFAGRGEEKEPLLIFDLAIPRDVDPLVADLPGIEVHDLDTLAPRETGERWSDDIRAMEAVIGAELNEFRTWALTRRVVPVISHLRQHVEAVSAAELKRAASQLQDLTPAERDAVESLTNRLIDKMFHHLVMRLRLAAQTDPALVEAAEFFFLHGEGGLFEDAGERKRTEAERS